MNTTPTPSVGTLPPIVEDEHTDNPHPIRRTGDDEVRYAEESEDEDEDEDEWL